MAPDLLDLDTGGLLQREAAHAGAECDEAEAARAQLVRLGESARGRAPDDLRRGWAAELHRGRVDHPAAGHLAGAGLDRLAEPDRGALVALRLDARTAG